jgi:hypothetical protein
MERWGDINHPLVKAIAGSSVPLFLALNFPSVFLALVVGILFYATALLGVVSIYRRRYRIAGRPELALRLAAKTFSHFKRDCIRAVARGLERRQSQRSIRQERKARLRRYRRERNRKKREQAREALAPTPGTGRWRQLR